MAKRLAQLPQMVALPKHNFRRGDNDPVFRSKEHVYAQVVLRSHFAASFRLAGDRMSDDASYGSFIREYVPHLADEVHMLGRQPHIVNTKTCLASGIAFDDQSVTEYAADLDAIVRKWVPMFMSYFRDPCDVVAQSMVRTALLRVSPWLMHPRLNAADLFRVLLPCEHAHLLVATNGDRLTDSTKEVCHVCAADVA